MLESEIDQISFAVFLILSLMFLCVLFLTYIFQYVKINCSIFKREEEVVSKQTFLNFIPSPHPSPPPPTYFRTTLSFLSKDFENKIVGIWRLKILEQR